MHDLSSKADILSKFRPRCLLFPGPVLHKSDVPQSVRPGSQNVNFELK
jgi:hypothetical protein